LRPPSGEEIYEAPCWHPFLEMLGNAERMPATSPGGFLLKSLWSLDHGHVMKIALEELKRRRPIGWDNFGLQVPLQYALQRAAAISAETGTCA
jgi:hypothetical protein